MKNIWWAKKGIFSFSFVPIELLGYAGATMTVLSVPLACNRTFHGVFVFVQFLVHATTRSF